jgi:AcrR family transcriptional regulator
VSVDVPSPTERTQPGGRSNQKLRTRRALIEAANQLLDRGRTPSIDEVAEAAMVSRATAYRHFKSVDEIIADAFFEHRMAEADAEIAGWPTGLVDRLLATEAVVNEALLGDEVALHVIARMFMDRWLHSDPDEDPRAEPSRPRRRLPFIDAAIDPAAEHLSPPTRRRLRNAAALVIGMEAVLSLRDVCELDREEARETARWAIEALVARAERDG